MRSGLFAFISALVWTGVVHAEDPITFTARSGQEVAAFQGAFEVPENRADPNTRMIELGYVRFPALEGVEGPPIIYLAGGPGGSGTGTARGRRFDLFMRLRAHGDVIAFDQRGTGLSDNDLPECETDIFIDDTVAISDEAYAQIYRDTAAQCWTYWQDQGVDIRGYTTQDSVRDLSALREHLGADSVVLWGISYGTHLAMAALKDHPDTIDRVILASAEGLDQTVKLPVQTDAYFERLQQAVNTQPEAAAAYPDIAAMMRRVHARLEAEPVLVQVPQQDGSSEPLLLQRYMLQQFASGLISDPERTAVLLAMYADLDAGGHDVAAFMASRFFDLGEPMGLRPMSTAMDMASGISAPRLALVEAQSETGLLRDYLNFPMPQLSGTWEGIDLGDGFRSSPTGDTPVLLLSGTLDGRTYVDSQREALAQMDNVTAITVVNAGHNLFMSSPEVHQAMQAFLRGEAIEQTEISVPLPDFMDVPFPR